MLRVFDRAGSVTGSPLSPQTVWPSASDQQRRHPEGGDFAARWLACVCPCQRFACRPCGRTRMTRGQGGWLGLPCTTLSFSTPRRSSRRTSQHGGFGTRRGERRRGGGQRRWRHNTDGFLRRSAHHPAGTSTWIPALALAGGGATRAQCAKRPICADDLHERPGGQASEGDPRITTGPPARDLPERSIAQASLTLSSARCT